MQTSPAEQRICSAFVSLYQEGSANRIKVKDVCEKAGVSRTTFYTYFESVDHLRRVIEETTLSEVAELFRDFKYLDINQFRSKDRPFPMFVRVYEYIGSRRETFKALFGPHADHEFILRYNHMVGESVRMILGKRMDTSSQAIVSALSEGAIVQVSQDWLFDKSHYSPTELGIICTRAVVALVEEWER